MAHFDGSLDALIRVVEEAGQLKTLRRAGWVRVGVPEPESVADHTFRVALLALLFGPRLGLDADTMVRLALVHDLGEARLGDITPADRIGKAEKSRAEAVAFGEIVAGLPEGPALFDLWREYDAGATPEARAVSQLDKLEMAFQA
ncbi:MAG TPA: HD domain-containing protein, partial [Chloroflexota bacterium]|nr:HD domain-containing protein [Chloroflexota bacterium]